MLDSLGMPGGGGGQSGLSTSGFSMSSILKHQEDYHRLGKVDMELGDGDQVDLTEDEEAEADKDPLTQEGRSSAASGLRQVARCALGGLVFLLVVFGIAALFLFIFYLFSDK